MGWSQSQLTFDGGRVRKDRSPVHHRAYTLRQANVHADVPVDNLTCTSLDCEKKPEHPEVTLTETSIQTPNRKGLNLKPSYYEESVLTTAP